MCKLPVLFVLVVSGLIAGCAGRIVRPIGDTILETNDAADKGDGFQAVVSRMQQPELYDDDATNNSVVHQTPFSASNETLGDGCGTYWSHGVVNFGDAAGNSFAVDITEVRGRLTRWVFSSSDLAKARELRDDVAAQISGHPLR